MRISKLFLPFLALVALLNAGALRADTVSFGTTGSFDGGANSITFGSGVNTLTLNFNGLSDTVNDDPFSFINLGQFQTSVTGSGANITSGTTFTLDINQLGPTVGSADLSGTLSGTISQNRRGYVFIVIGDDRWRALQSAQQQHPAGVTEQHRAYHVAGHGVSGAGTYCHFHDDVQRGAGGRDKAPVASARLTASQGVEKTIPLSMNNGLV